MKVQCQFLIGSLLLLCSIHSFAAVRYVDANNATPVPPYLSWATAATVLQDAVDAASAGDEILVTNGVYATGGRAVFSPMTNRVAVDRPLWIHSVNGAQFTHIVGYQVPGTTNDDGAIRCVYLMNNAALSGFTLTNGATRRTGDLDREWSGGAVLCESSTATISNCIAAGNSARANGIVLNGTLLNCVLTNNAVGVSSCLLSNCLLGDNYQGGAYASVLYQCTIRNSGFGASGNSTLNNCLLTGNPGGGARFSTLTNCVLTGNSGEGGAFHCTLVNCTLANNQSIYYAGGVSESTLYNCIAFFNTGVSGANYLNCTLNYCCTTPQPSSGLGNMSSDPRFVDATVTNLHLQPSSPCINSGANSYITATTDFESNPRIVDSIVDIGAYEFTGAVGFTTHYVAANTVNPVAPYTSWSTAAAQIQEAIDVAAPGDEIVVSNGVYATGGRAVYGTMTNRVVINKPLFVHSLNGPQFTIVEGRQSPGITNGPDAIRCVYLSDGASLSGFTLRGGATHNAGATYLEQSGGGIWCTSLSVAVSNCVLAGNSANYSGGGSLYGTFQNCAFFGNRAGEFGGGAYNPGAMNNCTVVGNAAKDDGGVGAGTLNNCIVFYNTPDNYSFYTQLKYSCTTPLIGGDGNIALDPQLASLTHLSASSPCRGAGLATHAQGTDIDGEPWLNPPAMGCDEFRSGSVTGPLKVAIGLTFTNVLAGYSLSLTALIDGRTSASTWDFADGSRSTNQPITSHAWGALGDYPVVLRAFNENFPAGISATVTVHVIAPPVYYVSVNSPNPMPPFSSWGTAATNIQNAIDAATVPGALVLVSNGVYKTGGRLASGNDSNRVAAYKNLKVQSVNGASFTFIDGLGAMRCVYLADGASLSGFTLTNGLANYGAGVWTEATNTLVSDCVLSGNYAYISGGGAYGAILTNCTFTGNFAGSGGGATECTLNNCQLLTNGASYAGGGTAGGQLNNCLLFGNWSTNGGGAFFSYGAEGMMNDCTVSGNSAQSGGGVFLNTNALLRNCILFFNSAPNGSNYFGYGNYIQYSCSAPLSPGNGNITNDPLFVDRAAGNLRLKPESPCVNAGNNAFVVTSTDVDGKPRIINGTVDMGAYEYQGSSGTTGFHAWLAQHGLPADGSADYLDTDGDGMNNWQEWRAGTNPTNAASALRIISVQPTGTNVALTWQSVLGIGYFVHRGNDLVSPGLTNVIGTNIAGQALSTSFLDTNSPNGSRSFFRVGVQ
jgi:hypothetical protein